MLGGDEGVVVALDLHRPDTRADPGRLRARLSQRPCFPGTALRSGGRDGGPVTASARWRPVAGLLRQRNLTRLLAAGLVTDTGVWLVLIALSIYVLEQTDFGADHLHGLRRRVVPQPAPRASRRRARRSVQSSAHPHARLSRAGGDTAAAVGRLARAPPCSHLRRDVLAGQPGADCRAGSGCPARLHWRSSCRCRPPLRSFPAPASERTQAG